MTNTKVTKARYFSALKALDEGPRTIEAAKQQYDTDMAAVSEMESKGNWSPNAIQRMKTQAQTKRDDSIRKAVDLMRPALETVYNEQSAPADVLDIDNPSLQNALRVINSLGKKVSASTQLSILEKFRGDTAALDYLADVYEKNGLFFAQTARDMTRGVNNEALEDVAYCIGSYDLLGEWPSDRLRWTGNEFNKALQRYGVNPTSDPYSDALRQLRRNAESESVRQAAAQALATAENNGESNADVLKAALDECMTIMEAEE